MRNFVEFVAAETGRKMAIPSKYICGVSGVDGGITKITPYYQESDGTLTYPNSDEVEASQITSTTSYDVIMSQLRD